MIMKLYLKVLLIVTMILNSCAEVKQKDDQLAIEFLNASGPAPYIFWQWMNGWVSKEGITYDLESYKKVGITNVQQFLVGGSEVDITDSTVSVLGEKWNDLMRFSLDECKRLGMDFGTHNSPGWSSSAAPGLKVENSMQKLIWTKTKVAGKTSKGIFIPRANIDPKYNYYKDICLIVMPANMEVINKDDIKVIFDGVDDMNKFIDLGT